MKTKIIGIVLGMVLIGLVGATEINITAGENYSFDIGEPYDYYTITGNQTELDLNINQSGCIVTIIIGKYMKSDLFTLTFFNEKDEVIHQSSNNVGGSTTRYLNKNTTEIVEVVEIVDQNITKEVPEEIEELEEGEKEPFKWKLFLLIAIILLVIVLIIMLVRYKRKKKLKERRETKTYLVRSDEEEGKK